jgi:hypothetical protein
MALTQAAHAGKLIAPRVLVTNFHTPSKKYAFLRQSIADLFLDPLQQTKYFQILSRTKEGLEANIEQDLRQIIATAKEAEADIAVRGEYNVEDKTLALKLEAIDIDAQKTAVQKDYKLSLNGDFFPALKKALADFSQVMTERIPKREKIKTGFFENSTLSLGAGYPALLTGAYAEIYNPLFMVRADFSRPVYRFWRITFGAGASAALQYLQSKADYRSSLSMNQIFAGAALSADYNLPWNNWSLRFQSVPGYAISSISRNQGLGNETLRSGDFYWANSIEAHYGIFRNTFLIFSTSITTIFYTSQALNQLQLGAGYGITL